ncbi:hypothetical protein MSAS_37530 [Mycobacterium saskatchewanense]|nr:thiamine pyrophosphate-binding protein [Mycobacterium saskatchewanense]BBX64579.1 hypothetical protein MSAS_37530 [Mycobacterium saskatchewanense]
MHNRHLLSNAIGRQRFADQLVDHLISLGVEYLFGMPAESVNSLMHAASRRSEIRVVSARHETAAALMAVGYARSSGRLGVCFGTAGPGATNLVAGAYEAFVGRVPLLAISGQVPLAAMGTGSFQEIDSESLFRPCTSLSVQIDGPSQFERLARCCVQAVHESTACHVAIPGDVLYAPIGAHGSRVFVPDPPNPAAAAKEEISAILDFLGSGDLAIVLSCASGPQRVLARQLSERLDCPLHTAEGRDAGVIGAADVLVVGRASPLLAQRVRGHANLLELTDRRFASGSMPYIRQIVCDVEATLATVLGFVPAQPGSLPERSAARETDDGAADSVRWRVYTDLDGADGLLPQGIALDDAVVSSVARIPGAALPLAIGGALGGHGDPPSLVVTDHAQLGQFIADVSTLASLGGDVLVVCRVGDGESLSGASQLGAAMSVPAVRAENGADLSRLFRRLAENGGPGIVTVRGAPAASPEARPLRPGERALAERLAACLAVPVQLSEFCAPLLPCFTTAQRSANAQAPSMNASALRKCGNARAGTVAATGAALLLQLNGIYDAALDNARILVATVEARDWALDARGLLDEVSVARYTVDDPATAAATVRQACAAAGAPGGGVVHLHVGSRALDAEWTPDTADPGAAGPRPAGARHGQPPSESALSAAIAALRDADRVAIVAGRGAAGCSDLLVELSEILCCPVYLTMGGDSVLADPGLRARGRIGGSGDLRAFHEVARADVLLLIGVSNRGSAFDLAAAGRTIAVNLDPHAMLRLSRRDICVLADAAPAVEAMVAALRAAPPAGAFRRRAARVGTVPRIARRRGDNGRLRASRLTRVIDEELRRFDGASTVCADVGVNTLWVYRHITSMTRSVWSASFGTMGFAVPAAIAVARNSVPSSSEPALVVAVAGDGGTSVTLSQIRSSAGLATPIVFVVVNNLALAAIKFESEIMGWPDRASSIPDINFAKYAASLGIRSRRVDTPRGFRAAFQEAISEPRPFLIDARCVVNDAPIQAGRSDWRQVAGFLLAWSQEGRDAVGSFREVVRAVVIGKLYEKGLSW